MRRLLLLAALALAGCAAPLKSTLVPATAGAADFTGAQGASVAPDAADGQGTRLRTDLEKRLALKNWGVPLQIGRTRQGFLRLRLGADESFERGTATLTPQALLVLSEAAAAAQAYPAHVVHVIAHGADPGSEPSASLSVRRAASVQSYLASRGLPPTRLRAEGRDTREPAAANPADATNWRVELVFRPVVTGRESEAWVPPQGAES